jgi:hypothetical protein
LPIGIALLVVVASTLRTIHAEKGTALRWAGYSFWVVALGCVLLGVLGSAALLAAKATFGSILPTLVTTMDPPITRDLARAYAAQFVIGEDTLNTRLTIQWWSVFFLAVGGIAFAALWASLSL